MSVSICVALAIWPCASRMTTVSTLRGGMTTAAGCSVKSFTTRDHSLSPVRAESASISPLFSTMAEAARKAVLAQLSYTIVKAPFDGVITEKKVEIGELASPGQPLLKMEDPEQLRLEATVAESDVRVVSVGFLVPVVIDALGTDPLKGKVSQILPAGDPQTHTFTMKVELPKTAGLKSGMFGRLRLEKGMTTTLLLPKSAFIERGELASLFVVGSDRVARLRWVKIGRTFEQGIEILSGVDAGERVIVDGTKGRDGALVQEMTAVASPSPGS